MIENIKEKESNRSLFQWNLRGPGDPLGELISKKLNFPSIFINREVLRADYIPSNLPHRVEHIKKLGETLLPIFRSSRPSNIFIYGKTGTGKTAVLKYVFNRFSEEASKRSLPLNFTYINCRIVGTEYRVLASLCESIGFKIPFTGLSTAEVFNRFKTALFNNGLSLVIGLDEIDALVKNYGDNLLYELTRINEISSNIQLSLVCVSNDLMFKELLDPRVLSSLSEEEIVFHPYSAIELRDILSERVSAAFKPGVVSEEIINLCAALAAAEHGDARRALDLLRVAGEVAERNGSPIIKETHVRLAQGIIERGRIFEALTTMPLHSRIILLSILILKRNNIDMVTSGNVYEVYKEICNQLNLDPLTFRRVSGLLSELDMMGLLKCKITNFGRYGRTKTINLNIPIEEIYSIFKNDESLSSLLNFIPRSINKKK